MMDEDMLSPLENLLRSAVSNSSSVIFLLESFSVSLNIFRSITNKVDLMPTVFIQ